MPIKIQQVVNGKWKENCYIIHNNASQHALIIDPGNAADQILTYVESHRLKVLAIINTHAHYDHIGAVAELKDTFSVPFYLHSKDLKLLTKANLYTKIFGGRDFLTIPTVDHFIDQMALPFFLNGFSIDIVFTPGHTKGSICILINEHLFTGDTLFNGKIGRTDLPGGNQEALSTSLKQLSQLSPNLKIYPGHGRLSTLQEELQHNREFLENIQ